MKGLEWIFGLVCAFCVIFVLLITSTEWVLYGNKGFFEKEYQKYHVAEDVDMEMKDLLYVTQEMMSYLRGDRENLSIKTMIGGEEQEFFNAREKAHMADVRVLFVRAERMRNVLLGVVMVCFLFFMKYGKKSRLLWAFQIGVGILFLSTLVLAAAAVAHFDQCFVRFHKIFFNNNLWVLDPEKDRLINIVPEPFFMDTAAQIGIIFITAMVVLCTICTFWILRGKKAVE